MEYDFCGWATRNDIPCSDGRTIRHNAFKDNDGMTVPLVWNHDHNEPSNVLGHALLENRDEGVYTYCKCNDTQMGKTAKELIKHGDITALSIYANKLKQNGGDVIHGAIREVSLVLAGANPGAYIETVMAHSDEDGEAAIIWNDVEGLDMYHAEQDEELMHEDKSVNSDNGQQKTVGDVINELTDEQKKVVFALIGMAKEAGADTEEEKEEPQKEEKEMKHNVFANEEGAMTGDALTHSEEATIIGDAKRFGSLKESVLQHSAEYGIENIDWLFPDARKINNTPDFIKREMSWVQKVLGGTHHTPFSRIKSMFADITADEARARGYVKGQKKVEEVISLLRRTTDPQTIYKKQKLDRDDIIDITDFDVVSWLKAEMRMMLDEEIARAILIGDGRLPSDNYKIQESHIRPIFNDDDLYTIKKQVTVGTTGEETAKNFIKAVIKARKDYKGSGNPTLYTTEEVLTDMLLIEDGIGHFLYESEEQLKNKLRVKEIITVEPMETQKGANGGDLMGVIVNLADYNVGADKGGSINMFEDFDIDYNQEKYLIETRCSGALIKPYSAIALEKAVSAG